MNMGKRLFVGAVAIGLVAGSSSVLAGPKPAGRNTGVTTTTPDRGILEGIALRPLKDLQITREDVPAGARTVVILDDATRSRGRASSHVAETFVYKNFSAGRNNQSAFFFNWKTSIGGGAGQMDADCPAGPDCFAPVVPVPGIFHADGAIFGGGFESGVTAVSSYEIFAFRSSSDPDTQDLAFIEMELWDGDPLNAFDSTGVGECSDGELCKADSDCDRGTCPTDGMPCLVDADCATAGDVCAVAAGTCGARFGASPIPGTKVTFSNVPFFTKIVFRGELDPPVVTPHGRVWVVVTSDACRFGWLLSGNSPEVGGDDQARLDALTGSADGIFELQLDTNGDSNGLGTCCGDACDDAPCDLSVGMACCDDPTGGRGQCVDGDAEDSTLASFGGGCSGDPLAVGDGCSNFWLNILAVANVTMTLQPTGNAAGGALAAGASIVGNEIIMGAGGENVLMDIQVSNFDTSTQLFCVGGSSPGAACTEATETADCGPVDPNGDLGPPSFGCGLKMRAYQSEIDSSGYTSGIVGEMTKANISCAAASDCVAALGGACEIGGEACTMDVACPLNALLGEKCVGPLCALGTCEFVFINGKRGDYVFRGLDELAAVDISTADFRWGSALNGPAIRPPSPFPAGGVNTGQLVMATSADAKGTFTLNLKPVPLSLLLDAQSGFVDLLGFIPAKITVSTGQCCNLDLATPVCVTDQVTAAGCDQLGVDNGFTTSFNSANTCADQCSPCPNGLDSECDDGDACTTDTCINALSCENVLDANDGTQCLDGTGATCVLTTIDDGDQCTDDACSDGGIRGVAGSTVSSSARTCDDGTPCTINDACDGTNNAANGGCAGSLVTDITCASDADCPNDPAGNPFPCVSGSCFCSETPDAGFVVTGGTAGVDPVTGDPIVCADPGQKVLVNIELGSSASTINGGQFIVNWDPTCLDFQGITTAAPYTTVLSEIVDAANGTLFWAVGIDPFNPPTTRGSNFGNLSFVKIPGCGSCEVCLDGANPQNLVLVDDAGDPVNVNPSCSDPIRTTPGVGLHVPASQTVNAGCNGNTAIVTWAAPASAGGCPGTTLVCSGVHVDSGTDLTGIVMTGGEIPLGTSMFSCTATNDGGCAASSSQSWTITVNDETTLDVVVQLSPTIATSDMTRAIDFELFSDCVQGPQTFTRDLRFGGVFDLTAHFTDAVKTAAAGQFVCITARDRLHTLRSVDFLTCADGVYSAVFKGDPFFGGNWLIGGNLDGWKPGAGIPGGNPDVIDILDFGQFVAGLGTCPGADTPDGTAGPHADINGDGCVDTLDFSFIDRNFLGVSKNSCCPGSAAAAVTAVTEISVRDLRAQGLGALTVADLNGDGMVNAADMAAFSAGAVPTAKTPVRSRKGSGLRSRE